MTFSQDECVVVSEEDGDDPTVITAAYRCVYSFARALHPADRGLPCRPTRLVIS